MQQTIQKSLSFTGTGLHSGAEVTMTFHPAGVNAGICFVRSDVADRDNHVPALWDRVVDTRLCTVLGNEAGVTVGTVEHLMAALRGCGIDNLVIALDGPEVPIMDGSAAPFIEKIDEAGLKKQTKPRRAIRILKDIVWEKDGKRAAFRPADSFVFQGEIAFDHPEIGRQERTVSLVNGAFREEIANARTFGFAHEVVALRQAGLALGGSLDNAIVLDETKVLNKGGLRHADEFIRHKLLDAVGDIYLAGLPILGLYESARPGHAVNNALLRQLFTQRDAWDVVTLPAEENSAAPVFRETLRAAA